MLTSARLCNNQPIVGTMQTSKMMPASLCSHLHQPSCSPRYARGIYAITRFQPNHTRGSRVTTSPRSRQAFDGSPRLALPAGRPSPLLHSGFDIAASTTISTWHGLSALSQSCIRLISLTLMALYAADLAVKYVTYAAEQAKKVCLHLQYVASV